MCQAAKHPSLAWAPGMPTCATSAAIASSSRMSSSGSSPSPRSTCAGQSGPGKAGSGSEGHCAAHAHQGSTRR